MVCSEFSKKLLPAHEAAERDGLSSVNGTISLIVLFDSTCRPVVLLDSSAFEKVSLQGKAVKNVTPA